jgi:1,4-alpha-glucan branching enzyme/maltooligosyltrehalose trehalohydrolase
MAETVELSLEGDGSRKLLPMKEQPEGWYSLETGEAGAGSLYRFCIDGQLYVPDPTSRYQPAGIHGPSEVIEPDSFSWQDRKLQGRNWEDCVLYEIHVGAFTPEGTFESLEKRLDYLADLGITAIELMPVAQFPGTANWGYDGALLFAPHSSYGRPEQLKALIQAAHQRNMMVFLDVVYNHFGPEGNYLYVYARDSFFTEKYHTPWGAAINYDEKTGRMVRDFFISNALYWLEEFHFDGLRFDAVHAIYDDSDVHILTEIAETVRRTITDRKVHLVLENDRNEAHYLVRDARKSPRLFTAQWNDDIHHAAHVLLTGEKSGYYGDYIDSPIDYLGRCLTEGFGYQGEISPYRHGRRRGEKSGHLLPTAFVSFVQNHDQIGNRALGERLVSLCDREALDIAVSLMLLAPSPPLLFMGEEHGSTRPFYYFCDFGPELAAKVTQGRRQEFARFPEFADAAARNKIPDPNALSTFTASKISWKDAASPAGKEIYKFYRRLLKIRHTVIVPLLAELTPAKCGYRPLSARALESWWRTEYGQRLSVCCNLGSDPVPVSAAAETAVIYARPQNSVAACQKGVLPGHSIIWSLSKTAAK